MKGFVGVTQGEDPCLIGLLPLGILVARYAKGGAGIR